MSIYHNVKIYLIISCILLRAVFRFGKTYPQEGSWFQTLARRKARFEIAQRQFQPTVFVMIVVANSKSDVDCISG